MNWLPANLVALSLLCYHFQQKLDNLPDKLKYLALHWNYKQPTHKLPNSIVEIRLESGFDTSLLTIPKNALCIQREEWKKWRVIQHPTDKQKNNTVMENFEPKSWWD